MNHAGILLVIGAILGFFGVLVSVFADGSLSERMVTICIILLIYGVLSAVWAFFQPKYSWFWGLILALPGVLILGVFMLREFNPYYLIYMILIISLSCLGAYGGSRIKSRQKANL